MNRVQRRIRAVMVGLVVAFSPALPAFAQKGVPPSSVIVGGQPMVSDRDIMDNLARSADHTVFVELIRLAGMMDGLRGHGPFTVMAPTNAAFAALPAGMLDTLRRPENKNNLVALLSMQIVSGNYSSNRLRYLLRSMKGQVELDTVGEGKLTVIANGPTNLAVRDPKGGLASIVLYDAKQANGVLFVTDRVLAPG